MPARSSTLAGDPRPPPEIGAATAPDPRTVEVHRNGRPTETFGPPLALAENDLLLRRYGRLREPAVRDELVRRYLPFARAMALRYRAGSEPREDLVQVASLGLVNAIDRFDPERGIPFIGFAAPTVLGELRRHFRDRVWNLRLPRGLQERVVKVDAAVTKLTGLLGRPPTIREIASHLEISDEDVLEAFAGSEARRIRSLDQPVGGGADADFTVGDRVGIEETGFELAEHRATIDTALPVLSEREREVIRLRFVDDMTQSQIAERIGHSQMHVSRILRGALARLHEEMAGGGEVESGAKRVLPS